MPRLPFGLFASLCLAVLWSSVQAAPVLAQDPDQRGDSCGPRLLRFDEPATLRWRLDAVADPRHRYGFRTPYVDGPPCTPGASGAVDGRGGATEVRIGGGVEHNDVRFSALGTGREVLAQSRENRLVPATSARGWWTTGDHVDLALEVSSFGGEVEVDEASMLVVGGPFYGWVGRRAVGYGVGAGGSIVLSGSVPLDGVGFGVRRPFRLPWLLKWLGWWDLEGVVARASDNGNIGNPYFGAARGTWMPFPGITFGTSRGAMAHGEGAPGLTGRRLWSTILGSHLEEDGERLQFNNQIMTLDAVIRAPIAGLSWAVYAELGAEDSAGAWVESPSIMAGVEVAHPANGWLLGLNHAYMHPVNGHGYFYRHSLYGAGWSDEGRGLGHPLGGPGREWRVHGISSESSGRWDLDVGLFVRDRYEGTSLGQDFEGRSTGAGINGRATVGSVDLFARIEGEHHESGLDRVVGELGVRWTRGAIR